MNRVQFLTTRLSRFLTERRVAPRSLSTPQAQADETKALLRIVLARAPSETFEEWWDEVEMFIGSHATTRAWPTEKEMIEATAAAGSRRGGHASEEAKEGDAVRAMADWYHRKGTQMPGMGRASRTAALIELGVFANEREARFKGFELSFEGNRKAKGYREPDGTWVYGQRMGRAEWDHQVNVMARFARFDGMQRHEIEREVARDLSAYELPERVSQFGYWDEPKARVMPERTFRDMGEAIARPEAHDDDFVLDDEPTTSPQDAAARPYTDAELARMRAIRPQQPEEMQA